MATQKNEKSAHALKVAELEKTYPRNANFVMDGKLFFFRPPELEEFEEAQAELSKGEKLRGVCFREIAQRTLVYPEGDSGVAELAALFAKRPVIPARIFDALADIGGAEVEITVKKD